MNMVRLLLQNGHNVDVLTKNIVSPLEIALKGIKEDMTQIILDCEFDVNLRNEDGLTALFIALSCS